MTSHRNNFDLLRLFAALQVFLVHLIDWMKAPAPMLVFYLFPGVAIFFMISGFLVAGSYLRPDQTLHSYFKGRALRIYPALWLNIAVLIVMLWIGGSLYLNVFSLRFWAWLAIAFPLGSDYLAGLLVGPILAEGGHFFAFPSGVLWTLPVELSFYCLVPIIFAKSVRRRGLIGVALLFWLVVSLVCFATIDRIAHPVFIGIYLWIFLLGAAIQVYWRSVRRFFEGKAAVWIVVYVAATYFSHHLVGQPFNFTVPAVHNITLTVLLAGVVISSAFTFPRAASILRGNDISYGLYLWHMPVIWTLLGFGFVGTAPATIAVPIALTLATISWRLVERPALAMKQEAVRLVRSPQPT